LLLKKQHHHNNLMTSVNMAKGSMANSFLVCVIIPGMSARHRPRWLEGAKKA
jgi:hypothetical protein